MPRQKWNALDQLCDTIRDMGEITYLHAGLFQSPHKRFKEAYSVSPKRQEAL